MSNEHTDTPTPAQSATPRTDAVAPITIHDANGIPYESDLVDADFARTLETELVASRAECEMLRIVNEAEENGITKLCEERDRAEDVADKLTSRILGEFARRATA